MAFLARGTSVSATAGCPVSTHAGTATRAQSAVIACNGKKQPEAEHHDKGSRHDHSFPDHSIILSPETGASKGPITATDWLQRLPALTIRSAKRILSG